MAQRRSAWFTKGMWVYLVIVATIFLAIGGLNAGVITGTYFTALAGFWITVGAVLLIKMWLEKQRLELDRAVRHQQLELEENKHRLQKLIEER